MENGHWSTGIGSNTGNNTAVCLVIHSLGSLSTCKNAEFPFTHFMANSAKSVPRAGHLLGLLTTVSSDNLGIILSPLLFQQSKKGDHYSSLDLLTTSSN